MYATHTFIRIRICMKCQILAPQNRRETSFKTSKIVNKSKASEIKPNKRHQHYSIVYSDRVPFLSEKNCFYIVIFCTHFIEIKMDECFAESLVYSESDNSDAEEGGVQATTNHELTSPPKKEISEDPASQNDKSPENSEASDEDDMNKSIKKTRKNARILSSDDENENSDKEEHTNKSNLNMRPSICDSDTKSSSDGNQSETEVQAKKVNKKLKKKKQKSQKPKQVSNGSASDSESENEGSNRKRSISDRSGGSGGDSSGSNSSSADSNEETDNIENIKPREKTVQRVCSIQNCNYSKSEPQFFLNCLPLFFWVNLEYVRQTIRCQQKWLNNK